MNGIIKRAAAVLLAVTLLLTAFPLSAQAEDNNKEAVNTVQIDKTWLQAGNVLSVSTPEGSTLQYFVDGEKQEGDSLTLSPDFYEKWITVRAYFDGQEVGSDSIYFSKLPVIYINTDDGEPVTRKDVYKGGSMYIQNNTESDKAMYDGAISIKGRGNTTWLWPKKPYRIKLDKKTDLFGMGKNKNWVLLANYLDESFMRYDTAAKLSHEFGLTTMDCVWTDVVLNGEYAGNYQLCEHVRVDDDRVEVFDWEEEAKNVASAVVKAEKKKGNMLDKDALEDALQEDLSWITSGVFTFDNTVYTVADYYTVSEDLSGGYLFELTHNGDEVTKFRTESGLAVRVKSPEYAKTNSEMLAYAQRYWQAFEDASKSEDGYVQTEDGWVHYSELADFDSMIQYWLVMEILGNNDAMWKSRFAYKDAGGLLTFGPVWDFDYGCGSSVVTEYAPGWKVTNGEDSQMFYREFVDDPYFVCKAAEQYWKIRPVMEAIVEDGGALDQEFAYLYESGMADQQLWDRTEEFGEKARGYEKDFHMYQTFLRKRLAWLDEQFATDASAMASLYYEGSGSPYTKSEDIVITFSGTRKEQATQHAGAEFVLGANEVPKMNIFSGNDQTAAVKVYVNGIYRQTAELTDGRASLALTDVTENLHEKNVISLVGKDASDHTTERSYTTVIREERESAPVGDVNRDGRFDINDASYLQAHLAEFLDEAHAPLVDETHAESMRVADVNADGKINVFDVTVMQRMLAEME